MGFREAAVRLGLVEHDDDGLLYEEPAPADGYADDDQLLEGEETGGLPDVGPGFHIASIAPQNFADAHTIGEYFRHDIPVIINLHGMTAADAKRIVDFASGLIFGRRGDIERLSSRVFLIMPAHGRILKDPAPPPDKTFFNQA
ncbi:MAG TPA: cell division protein SepF [Streptosporangiaceae bacterium]|nr:cell division protein SepF [Streptosporangiaceae bacterium]